MTVHPQIRGEDASQPELSVAPEVRPERLFIALTIDPALCGALRDMAVDDIAVSIVADLHSLTDQLMQHSVSAALIDAAALGGPVTPVVDTLTRQFPDLRLMIAGQGAEQQLLATRIANQTVFRFVHKPASPQRLKLFLDAAARPGTGAASPTRAAPAGGDRLRYKSAAIGALVLASVAIGAWLVWPDGSPAAPTATQATRPADSTASLLAQADSALASGILVASDGSSAVELYRAVLQADPASQQARDGRERAIEAAVRSVEDSLLAGRLDDAGYTAAAIRRLAPDNPRLDFLDAQLARELERANADAAQRQAYELRQSQIRTFLASMSQRLQAGALLAPADGSAIAAYREAEAISMNDPAVRAARESLLATLLTTADTELVAGRTAAATRMVDAAASINGNAPGLDVLRRRIEEVQRVVAAPEPVLAPQRSEVAAVPSLPTPSPVLAPAIAPAPTPAVEAPPRAAAPAVTAEHPVAAGNLRALRRAEPVYPRRALDQLISGWVEMEFTVAADGSVQDIIVKNAEPANVFDAAATSALSRYRYAPVMKEGQPVPQRAYMRMRFTAQETR